MAGTEKNCLLIVDDVEMNRAILSSIFEDEYKIIEAENGQEALKRLEQNDGQIAAVLLDVVMPVMNGFEMLQYMKENNIGQDIPVFLIAIRLKGLRYLIHTLFATVMLSFWLSVLPVVPLAGDDLLLASLYGGILMGAGIGLVFVTGATTGGTDLIAALVQHFLRHYSISNILWVIDTAVVLVGVYLYGIQITLYAIIAIYLTSKISDGIIDGLKFSKAAFIITEKPEALAALVMEELGRGVTGISATGMYSGDSKNMLLCVVSKKEIVRLKELAKSCDPNAFVIVTDVREVLGEGFIEHHGSAGTP